MKIRRSARVVLIDCRSRVLLLCVEDPPHLGEGRFWIIPGGELEPGETFEAAARRELREETGILTEPLGPCVWTPRVRVRLKGEEVISDERYFLARIEEAGVVLDHQTDVVELNHSRGSAWWRVEEMKPSGERFLPPDLADLLAPLVLGRLPDEPIALG